MGKNKTLVKGTKYKDRIVSYLMNPMFMDVKFGLYEYLRFEQSLANPGPLSVEIYRKAMEEHNPTYYALPEDLEAGAFEVTDPSPKGEEPGIISSGPGQQRIVQLELKGPMISEGGLCSPGINRLCNQMLQAANDSSVSGILLNTHSGGGEVVAAQRLANAVMEANAKKPVIQFVDGLSASGAVFAGVYSEEIFLNSKTAETGSIGVVISVNKEDLTYLSENLIQIFSEGSGGMPGKQDVFRAILSNDFEFVRKNSLNPMRKVFVDNVKKQRPGVSEDVFSGTVFQGREAVKVGLADRIGTRTDALRRIGTLVRNRRRAANAKAAAALI